MRTLLLTLTLLALAACGGGTTTDAGTDSGSTDAGRDAGPTDAGHDAGMDAGPTDAGSMDAGSTDAGPTDAGHDAGPPADAATGMGTLTISGFSAYADCMPIVASDPIHATWTAMITGATGTTATLVDAKLTVAGVMQHLTLDVPNVALTAGAGSQAQTKTAADVGASCSSLCGAGVTATLDLSFDTTSGRLSATTSGSFGCAF